MKRIAITLAVLLVTLFMFVGVTSSTPYDPWYDFDDDGDIDIYDIVDIAGRYGTTGTPINKTELLLELQERVDLLNATITALQGGYVAETGEFNGEVNTDMVEKVGVTTINFNTPFTSVEKPGMVISVVLKQAANGLTEGSAIKVVEDIKGAAGNWYGFDLTVSKYSDGTSIDDTTLVYVTWIAIGTEPLEPQSNCLTIGPTAFTPDLPRLQAFWKTRYAVGGSGSSYASVRLPDGVQITNVTARLEDFYNDAQVSVGLHRVNITGPSETSDSLATIDSGTAAQLGDAILYDDTIDYAQIDNEHFYYVVELNLNYEASDLNLHWVQVTYES